MTITEESVRVLPRRLLERVACRVFLNADQADLTADSWNKINFNDETYDLGKNFDNSVNYRFNVPVTGLYGISAVINLISVILSRISFLRNLYESFRTKSRM